MSFITSTIVSTLLASFASAQLSLTTQYGPGSFCQGYSPGGGGDSCMTIPAGCYVVPSGYNVEPALTCKTSSSSGIPISTSNIPVISSSYSSPLLSSSSAGTAFSPTESSSASSTVSSFSSVAPSSSSSSTLSAPVSITPSAPATSAATPASSTAIQTSSLPVAVSGAVSKVNDAQNSAKAFKDNPTFDTKEAVQKAVEDAKNAAQHAKDAVTPSNPNFDDLIKASETLAEAEALADIAAALGPELAAAAAAAAAAEELEKANENKPTNHPSASQPSVSASITPSASFSSASTSSASSSVSSSSSACPFCVSCAVSKANPTRPGLQATISVRMDTAEHVFEAQLIATFLSAIASKYQTTNNLCSANGLYTRFIARTGAFPGKSGASVFTGGSPIAELVDNLSSDNRMIGNPPQSEMVFLDEHLNGLKRAVFAEETARFNFPPVANNVLAKVTRFAMLHEYLTNPDIVAIWKATSLRMHATLAKVDTESAAILNPGFSWAAEYRAWEDRFLFQQGALVEAALEAAIRDAKTQIQNNAAIGSQALRDSFVAIIDARTGIQGPAWPTRWLDIDDVLKM